MTEAKKKWFKKANAKLLLTTFYFIFLLKCWHQTLLLGTTIIRCHFVRNTQIHKHKNTHSGNLRIRIHIHIPIRIQQNTVEMRYFSGVYHDLPCIFPILILISLYEMLSSSSFYPRLNSIDYYFFGNCFHALCLA